MKKIIEEVIAAEGAKEQLKEQIKDEEKKTFGIRATTRDPSLKIAGVNNEDLEKVLESLTTTIKVVGCGGAGTNTITRCFGAGINGADLIAVNTDAQHLLLAESPYKILIGRHLTRGLGAGSLPQIGEEAAKESEQDIRDAIVPSDMVFVTCGLGGGTGTGCAPVVAQIAREAGALTIGFVTLPFCVEVQVRMDNAEAGLKRLREVCDTVIVIPNDKLLDIVQNLAMNAAFKVADEVLMHSIKGITEMITMPGLVNLDFADLKTVMKHGGAALIGLGEADGDNKAVDAISEALNSPLLEVDITEATGALVNVTGGNDMTLREVEKVVEEIYSKIYKSARIIWGTTIDPAMVKSIRAMLVITGVKSKQIIGPTQRSRDEKEFGIDFIS